MWAPVLLHTFLVAMEKRYMLPRQLSLGVWLLLCCVAVDEDTACEAAAHWHITRAVTNDGLYIETLPLFLCMLFDLEITYIIHITTVAACFLHTTRRTTRAVEAQPLVFKKIN